MFDDVFADGQPQAGAFGFIGQRVAHLHELFKDFFVIGGRNARLRSSFGLASPGIAGGLPR